MADPGVARNLMLGTYVVGAVGIAVGFYTVSGDPPSLTLACLLAVVGAGLLSFLRHSVFHRSDAVRMGWDMGVRDNFQIEVGIANLAWGAAGLIVVLLDAGLRAEATTFLTFGLYLIGVGVMVVAFPGNQKRRPAASTLGLAAFGLALAVLGVIGLLA